MYQSRWFSIVFFLVLCISVPPAAGETPPDESVLTLRSAIARGIEQNLALQVEELNIPIRQTGVTAGEAAFDPALEASLFASEQKILTGSVLYRDEYSHMEERGISLGVRKKFRFGLESRIGLRTLRSENNSLADALDPHYRSFLVLDLTQPLLRDFGVQVNTADLRIARNRVEQAVYDYLSRAREMALRIEQVYLNLAQAMSVLRYRIESRELARELMEGNRDKLKQGVISVTEVDQARSALMAREEAVLSTRQQVERITNHLKDLLEIRGDHPLYDKTIFTEDIPDENIAFPVLEEALAAALVRRADLKQMQMNVASQDIRLEYFANQKLPRLDLAATLGANGLSGDDRPVHLFGRTESSPLVGDYEDSLQRMAEADGYEWSVDLRFSYPIGNKAAKARYSRSLLEKRQAVLMVKQLEGNIETEVKNALVTVERSLERVRTAEKYENIARKVLKQEMARLMRGLSNTFRILDFQDDLISARIRKATAMTDYHLGLAELFRAMGTNLERYDIVAEVERRYFPQMGQ